MGRRILESCACLVVGFCQVAYGLPPDITFTDVTDQAGIDFRYTFGDTTYENILESSGSGITVFDYNNDGYMDIYMLNGTYLPGVSDPHGEIFADTPNCLYRNNGNGNFTEVAGETGLADTHWSMAAGAVDIDNDGYTDIFLLNYGPNVFYRNNGDGTFTDVTDSLGLRGPEKLNGYTKWSVGVAFWDYNRNGRIDCMVGNFLAFDPEYVSPTTPDIMPHPSEYAGQASLLYRQNEDGTFTEVTREAGLYYPDSKCMGLTVFDYDGDGDLDLFQANDHQKNFLFRNDGGGHFTEVGEASGVAVNDQGIPTGSMHGTIGDVDGDGYIDILVADLRYGALYRNLGNGIFEDITVRSGVAGAFNGKGAWAAALFDFDNDGDLDIFSANGIAEELILTRPLLLENNGKGYFADNGPNYSDYFNTVRSGRGAAVLDFDNDGDLDIIVSHVDLKATAVLLRNDGGHRNHWLGITLCGKHGPVSALGAKVEIHTGNRTQLRINQWATSYLSSHDPRIHFGLGKYRNIDTLIIHWPDGSCDEYREIPADQYITIHQGAGLRFE